MQYKTIVLELIKDRPQMYDQLRKDRLLLPIMDANARELKASHEAWKQQLSQARPGSDETQIATEAMELAIEEFARRLPPASDPDETEPLSLDAAMAFIKRHTPPA